MMWRLTLLLVLVLAGCGAGEDESHRRLEALAGDAVFASLPAGATAVERQQSPARYREPGFGGGGWDGPAVKVSFESEASPEEVYRFYAGRAAEGGWRALASGRLGQPDRWAKKVDGVEARLVLTSERPTGYRLVGSLPAPDG